MDTKTIQVKMQHTIKFLNTLFKINFLFCFLFFVFVYDLEHSQSLIYTHTRTHTLHSSRWHRFVCVCVSVLASDKRLIFFILTSSSHYHRSVLMQQFFELYVCVCVCNTRAAIRTIQKQLFNTNQPNRIIIACAFTVEFFLFYFVLCTSLFFFLFFVVVVD